MKLDRLLVALLIAFSLALLLVALAPRADNSTGIGHPRFSTMLSGGDGAERHGPLLWPGWLLGTTLFALLAGLMAFGARRAGRLHGLGWPLVLATVAVIGAWSWVVLAYARTLSTGETSWWLGLPLPTAVMIFVLYPVSAIFSLLYVVGFERWVLPGDELERFRRLVADKRRQAQED